MRTRLTNILQVIVLLSGLIYVAIGGVFFYSPIEFVRFFSVEVTDEWFKAIQFENFIAPLFFLARGFAAMIVAAGLSMILPLYDPLKYRGLIYYINIIFPVISSSLLLYGGLYFDHWILTVTGIVFAAIFILTVIGLIITNKQTKAGIE